MSDLSPIVFADLDDTLFQTAGKMSEPPSESRLASLSMNGRHSYMTQAQAATVRWLLESTRLIPTTARSSEVLARTKIPFRDYRICSNGGAIIDSEGEHDLSWAERAADISAAHAKAFSALQTSVAAAFKGPGLRSWLVYEGQTAIYFVAKTDADMALSVLDEVEVVCRDAAGDDLILHRNGRNLSFTPKGLTKVDAVEEMLARIPETDKRPIWGMGDSMSDLHFMSICQMMVIPSFSQISKSLLEI